MWCNLSCVNQLLLERVTSSPSPLLVTPQQAVEFHVPEINSENYCLVGLADSNDAEKILILLSQIEQEV